MIIHLNKSKLFTQHPAQSFADQYNVSETIWNEIWKRHSILDYTSKELCEFYYIKVGKPIRNDVMNRWLFRTKVYSMTKDIIKKGVKVVNSNFFGVLEEKVMNEVTRHMRAGEALDSEVMA